MANEFNIDIVVSKGQHHHFIARSVDHNFIAQGPDHELAIHCLIGAAITQAITDQDQDREIWSTRRINRPELREAFENAEIQYTVKMKKQGFVPNVQETQMPQINAEYTYDRSKESTAGVG